MANFRSNEVTIIGAGLVGTVVAMFLARRGVKVTIYEGRTDPRLSPNHAGRSINLTLAERGWQALRELGIDARIREISIALLGRQIHGEDGSERFQPYGDAGESIYSVSRTRLLTELLTLTERYPGIEIRFNHRCVDVDLAHHKLWFEPPQGGKPTAVSPARVLAADGAQSSVRRAMLRRGGMSLFQKYSGFQYRELALPPTPAGDWPMASNALHLWPRGDCMVVAFPNGDHSMTASVFMQATGTDPSFETINTPEHLNAFLGKICPDLLALVPDVAFDFFSRPPGTLLTSRCAPWVVDGWLGLIGDSAHSMVPFLGQGLNCGLEDSAVFDRCFAEHPDEWGDALAAYEELRRANCDAATELAEAHYVELARRARDPRFVAKKALEQKIYRMAPSRFVPAYNMVSFLDVPYLEVARRLELQEAFLEKLIALEPDEARWSAPEFEATIRKMLETLPLK